MSSINNFQELENQELDRMGEGPGRAVSNVNQKLHSNMRVFHFIGDIVELYFPKIVGLFVKMSGGGRKEDVNFKGGHKSDDYTRPKYPNTFE